MGIASRREAEAMILAGKLKVNGHIASLGQKMDPGVDRIEMNGRLMATKEPNKVYLLLHKPQGFLCSKKPEPGKETIFTLKSLKRLKLAVNSIGRLDYMSEGLLLLTNDGELNHRLCHPSFKLPRTYKVLVNKPLTPQTLANLRNGVMLKDGQARCDIVPANQINLGKSVGAFYFVTVFEGRNRLVRRLFESQDCTVLRLLRDGFGEMRLDSSLKAGEVRQLTSAEIAYLKQATGLPSSFSARSNNTKRPERTLSL